MSQKSHSWVGIYYFAHTQHINVHRIFILRNFSTLGVLEGQVLELTGAKIATTQTYDLSSGKQTHQCQIWDSGVSVTREKGLRALVMTGVV